MGDHHPTEDIDQPLARQLKQDYDILGSAIAGLYVEFDKLSKKQPGGQVSDLALETVNDAIRDSKGFLDGDRYVDRISEFVPAGENPVNSDVLLVLAQIKAALGRFRTSRSSAFSRHSIHLKDY